MSTTLINTRNGIRVKSEDFPSREEAERAKRTCELYIDRAILEIQSEYDSGTEGAIKELEAEKFEIVER